MTPSDTVFRFELIRMGSITLFIHEIAAQRDSVVASFFSLVLLVMSASSVTK